MAKESEIISGSVDELIKKSEEFEKTVLDLLENIKTFREKLKSNKDKYGPDITKWPREK